MVNYSAQGGSLETSEWKRGIEGKDNLFAIVLYMLEAGRKTMLNNVLVQGWGPQEQYDYSYATPLSQWLAFRAGAVKQTVSLVWLFSRSMWSYDWLAHL